MSQTEQSIAAQEPPWYCAFQGQILGPFTWPQMRERAATGQLSGTDLICQQGHKEWVAAASVSGLFGPFPNVTEGAARSVSDTPLGAFANSLVPPPRIPGYDILSEIGRGGMGIVYKARQVNLNRIVALKMILGADQASPSQRARFVSEAKALARVQHSGIVQIYDVGEHQGQPYLALQFVEGGSLKDHLRGQPLEPNEAATLVERLARAIHFAHEAGIVHRDLKPGNILIDRQGMPHITDFGLAKDLERETQQTQTGSVMGTPAYMAPEQAMGDSRGITPRTDIYALGAILYELLTGAPPFSGPAHVMIYNVVERLPDAPRRINPRVPSDLDAICMRCVAKKPGQRFPTALELADQLRHFVDAQITLAAPPLPGEESLPALAQPPRRSRGRWLAIVAGLIVVGVLAWRAERAGWVADRAERELAAERERVEELMKRDQENTRRQQRREALGRYSQSLHEAQIDWSIGKFERARLRLDLTPASARGWEWQHLDATAGQGPIQKFDGHAGGATCVAYSPDFTLLASGGADNVVRLWDTATGKEKHAYTSHAGGITAVAFSSDGKYLFSASRDRTVKIWNLATNQVQLTMTSHAYEVLALAVSPDGLRAVSGDSYGYVYLWNTATGTVTTSLESGTSYPCYAATWSADGKRLAWAAGSSSVKVWDTGPNRLLYTLSGHTNYVNALAFTPDGTRLASGGQDHLGKVWDMATGQEVYTLRGHVASLYGLVYTHDGRQLYSTSSDGTLRCWDMDTGKENIFGRRDVLVALLGLAYKHTDPKTIAIAVSDRTVRVWRAGLGQSRGNLAGHTDAVNAIAHSGKTGRFITASSDRTLKVWHAATGTELFPLSGHGGAVLALACSPDDQWVASASEDQTVRIWNVSTGRAEPTLRGHRKKVLCITYNNDGKTLFSGGEDGLVKVWDTTTLQAKTDFKGHEGAVFALACSPDGQRLLSAGADRVIRVWDVAAGTVAATLTGHVDPVRSLAYSPDGKSIASMDEEGVTKIWDAASGTERLSLRPFGANLGNFGLAFSADSQRLATAGPGEVRVWEVEEGDLLIAFKMEVAPLRQLTFTRDGRMLLLAGGSYGVVLHGGP